jgi:ABC-2 type transport system permease protein
MWPFRLAVARVRPWNAAALMRVVIVASVFALFLWGDFVLFRRLFGAVRQIEAATPFFALGILRNVLALVFLISTVVLFSSALTTAIGSFFTDLDLDLYHAAPRSRARIVAARYMKTFLQSAAVVIAFLIPMVAAFEHVYPQPASFHPVVLTNIILLLSAPVSLASVCIILLVRWFPVRRVHQIVATIAVLVLTTAVLAFRISRPERLFTPVGTDDVVTVLRAIELPGIGFYPGTALAERMAGQETRSFPPRIAVAAGASFGLFLAVSIPLYFAAFVRARESMAPPALGSALATRWLDRLFRRASPPLRAMAAKEIRTVTRDVAQWTQLLLMLALLFMYLYNIRMLPLGGDYRATLIAYVNIGMCGFVVAAICLRFAYPSISSEGKAFWLLQVAPVSYRHLLTVKVLVYGFPLVIMAVALTSVANVLLSANLTVWIFTVSASALTALTLVCLGVGMGALDPDFNAENPLQVGLSLGGFGYMAVSLLYVGAVMLLMARPLVRYFFWRVLGVGDDLSWLATALPIAAVIAGSFALAATALITAYKRLIRLGQRG